MTGGHDPEPVAGSDAWTRAATLGLVVLAVVILATFRDYGLSWDESHSAENGALALAWYRSLGGDDRILTAFNQTFYGSAFNVLVQLVAKISPFGFYETNHLLIAVFAWLGVVYTFRLGRLLDGPRTGFFAALFLALTPVYYGHAFMNPKDVPLAALFVAGAYYLVRATTELPEPSRRTLVAFGVITGCAAGVRVIGTFLLGYWGIAIALWWLAMLFAGRPRPPLGRVLGWWWKPAILAWGLMVLWWPYAQLDPVRNPVRAFLDNAKFKWPGNTLFDGHLILASDVPTRYLPTWFSISLPEFYAVALAAGALPLRRWRRRVVGGVAFLVVAVALAPALAIWRHAVLYDGMRHFLFTVPFLALLAGWGFSVAWGEVAALRGPWRPLTLLRGVVAAPLVGAALVSVGLTVADLVALHPYQYLYFNRLVAGGQAVASTRFETDYWGLSYKEALEWLRDNYPDEGTRVPVANCSIRFLTGYWIKRDPELSRRFADADQSQPHRILLATTRFNCHTRPGKTLHIVSRKGVPLAYVIEREE